MCVLPFARSVLNWKFAMKFHATLLRLFLIVFNETIWPMNKSRLFHTTYVRIVRVYVLNYHLGIHSRYISRWTAAAAASCCRRWIHVELYRVSSILFILFVSTNHVQKKRKNVARWTMNRNALCSVPNQLINGRTFIIENNCISEIR